MTGRDLVAGLTSGRCDRAPYLPLLGSVACELAQVDEGSFRERPEAHARALDMAAAAVGADGVVVGYGTRADVGVRAIEILTALLGSRGLAAHVSGPDVAGARAYCEANAQLVIAAIEKVDGLAKLKTLGRACAFYDVPVLLHGPAELDLVAVAAAAGLGGAIIEAPGGDEPGIVGGGLSCMSLDGADGFVPPRAERFFWTFAGEVPSGAEPEELAALGRRLTTPFEPR
jgi:hypothetical protein